MTQKKYAIIVAGGSGTRMGVSLPKQFLELDGLPILMHTIKAFQTASIEIELILILPANQIDRWNDLCKKHNFYCNHSIALGGNSRTESVRNGLDCITTEGLVAIHDGVRPFVSQELIDLCFNTANEKGSAIASVMLKESIRFVKADENKAVDRAEYRIMQTPQTFKVSLIKRAYAEAGSKEFLDDASVAEAAGAKIYLVNGSYDNIKITTLDDFDLASLIYSKKTEINKTPSQKN